MCFSAFLVCTAAEDCSTGVPANYSMEAMFEDMSQKRAVLVFHGIQVDKESFIQ